jgi:hypothetical protein
LLFPVGGCILTKTVLKKLCIRAVNHMYFVSHRPPLSADWFSLVLSW